MADVLKVLDEELALTTVANTVDGATLVRIINVSNDTAATITIKSGDTTIGSFTLNYAGSDESVVYVKKEAAETLTASANSLAKAVKVAFF